MSAAPNPKTRKPREVREMFARIAPGYDKINRAMTFGLDLLWRKSLARRAAAAAEGSALPVLDLACGSGDAALAVLKASPSAKIVCCDLCPEMLAEAERKIAAAGFKSRASFVLADAQNMPFAASSFCACAIAFGFRNFQNRKECLLEIRRVLADSAPLIILEVARAPKIIAPAQNFFMEKIMPRIASAFGGNIDDYKYLAKTTRDFPPQRKLESLVESCGFKDVKTRRFALGFTALTVSKK